MIKRIIMTAVVAAFAVFTGCKTMMTVDESYKLGWATGFTTAYVLDKQVKLDDASKTAIVEIVTQVQKYVPAATETFAAKWVPIANAYIDGLVTAGKLTVQQGERVKKDFNYIVCLLDSYVEKKGLKEYQDCIDAFVNGFCLKFLDYMKSTNGTLMSIQAPSSLKTAEKIDSYAYEYLTVKCNL